MSIFDEQISTRKLNDEKEFENAFLNIAGAVIGDKITAAFKDDRRIAKDSIDEILKFYHIDPVEVPKNITEIDEQLEYVLRPHGIMRRVVKLTKGWHKDAFGAMLGVRKDTGKIVALIPTGISGYCFKDSETGEKVKINKSNEDLFMDEATCFYTTFPLSKLTLKDIISYCLKIFRISDYMSIVIAALIATCIGLIVPEINRIIFDGVIASNDIKSLVAIAVFLICASISGLLFSTVQTIVSSRITTKMDVTVEAATMIRVISLPADFFKEYSAGELTTRIQYLNVLCDIVINVFLQTGLTSIFSLVYVFQIGKYAPALVGPALLIILATLILSVASTLYEMKISKKRMEVGAKVSGLSFALISGIQKIKLAGAEKRAFSKWGNEYANQADLTYNYPLFIKLTPVISTAITLVGTFVIYLAAVNSGISVSDYYAFNAAYAQVSTAFVMLAGTTGMIAQIKPILEMLSPILNAVPEISEKKKVVNRLSGGIEISNVKFRYEENMPYVVNDLSLKIKAGQYVAIVGKTGCGKSTLMRLLLGFEKPDKGAIYYDGKDMNTLDLKSLRQHIGTVLQNGTLFEGDIFSNITISAPMLTVEDAWEAARLAGVAEDIEKMPMGMFTLVSEGGGGLSGGQRQRLMIARAIASKPKVLMFDEATSALDNITQRIVSESLSSLKCTRIVIAHRLSTIKDCDRIIVLDGGKIIEDGTYEQLIANGGYFAELVERQRIDDK